MDLSQLKRELEASNELKAAADSPESQRLMQTVDTSALEAAAKSGDTAAMKKILSQVLSTPEGKALANKVQKAVQKGK